ncbi:phosphoribosyltransferase [Mucilaginibacter aquariorum]|uniref:Phosphoribosyltransferase family protein n=1 Tax=Mucilaginibacter aquariorum TaxID=2967225 RepID=A0ABT1T2A1_9SPHI|nr:phosphoribosyltransferase family protein [Mucilaginibacter aquariorum]MCQ6958741.1 phosphoribosyltransferase family protein [Mucilaginibacter aquariorum]
MFKDRTAVGHLLAAKLGVYKTVPGVVLAVPCGGVPVAYYVAKELGLPLDLVLVKKIGHPNNKEYAIGAASLTDHVVVPQPDVPASYIEQELLRIRKRLAEMSRKFRGDAAAINLAGKTVIVIDDGAATGQTLLRTLSLIKKSQPAKVVVALPVASRPAMQILEKEADEVVVCLIPSDFYGVGAYYENFTEVSDDEVSYYLDKLNRLQRAG